MTKITGTNTYIDVEIDGRTARIAGEMIIGGFVCFNDILGVEQYYFKENNYPPLFQVKLQNQLIIRDYFVTDEFMDIVKKNNIKGLKFKEIWDS